MATEKDARTVTLKGVRFSFTDALVEKRATSTDNPERKTHHLNIIIESVGPYAKHAEENRKKVLSAIKAAGLKAFKNENAYKDIQEDAPKRVCYRKGDRFKNKEGKIYEGYEGNHALSTSGPSGGQRRPRMIDRYKRILVGPGDSTPSNTKLEIRNVSGSEIGDVFYSGAYGDVTVSFYGTEKGSRGIFSTIDMIRSYQQGERMAGGYVVDDEDVEELEDFDANDDAFDDAPTSKAKAASIDDDDDL